MAEGFAGDDEIERSESGAPIYRYEPRFGPVQPPERSADHCDAISEHLGRHVGEVTSVFHEIVSDLVHIDVLLIPPGPGREHHTLVTSGMSDLPMAVPEGAEQWRHAELMICLPPDWPLPGVHEEADSEDWKSEAYYWPIRWLKMLARFPHEHETWLSLGHSVPNGDPAERLGPNTAMCGVILLSPISAEVLPLDLPDGARVNFLAIYPLYREEMDLKLKAGADALIDKLAEIDVSDVLDVDRPNACAPG